jgi:cell division septation protein DedD
MARLTSELASHKTLLDELRSLREADKHTLRQKVREVDLLRREVEKIAGEVEVLKGVVEEGLRERRERNISHTHDEPRAHGSGDREDNDDSEMEQDQGDEDERPGSQQDPDDYEIEDIQPALARRALLERKTLIGHATSGSVPMTGNGNNTRRRYVEDSEVERISVELEERRSERSRSSSRLGSSLSSNGSHRAPSVASSISSARNSYIAASLLERAATPDSIHQRRGQATSSPIPPTIQDARPPAPTPAQAARERHAAEETPFPQIRGARLERMFFSAPEHNTRTCTVCHRRRHREAAPRPLWYPASKGRNVTVAGANDEDEGFEEGSVAETGEGDNPIQGTAVNLGFLSKDARNEDLPPQTVLVRVLRELEDDFTHYKGYLLVPSQS